MGGGLLTKWSATTGNGAMIKEPRKIPSHEVVYARLRDMILFGILEPGQPVTIQGLVAQLEVGMTPVREAIRRLTAEGALMPQGNRRVTVPKMTPGVLEQVSFARMTIEPMLIEKAGAVLTPRMIERLAKLDEAVNQAIRTGDIPAYLESNHAFHFALYEATGATVLVDMVRSLWLRFGPSLRAVCARVGSLGLPDQHAAALAAMRAGDPAALRAAMERDIAQGIDQVRIVLGQADVRS
jgi:DNA-binding GntR family transcriptional regulator